MMARLVEKLKPRRAYTFRLWNVTNIDPNTSGLKFRHRALLPQDDSIFPLNPGLCKTSCKVQIGTAPACPVKISFREKCVWVYKCMIIRVIRAVVI